MQCVNCGENTSRPVQVVYADPAFESKQQEPFTVCPACFKRDETVTVSEWVDGELESREITRYRKVEA